MRISATQLWAVLAMGAAVVVLRFFGGAEMDAFVPTQAASTRSGPGHAVPCDGSDQASPFAVAAPCGAAVAPPAVSASLPELQQALNSVDPCASQRRDCRGNADPREKVLVQQLETLALTDAPGTRVALALQLQRQRAREGYNAENTAQRNQDSTLQRSVALLAEAAAAGDVQAQRYRDALGPEGARLLHTGR